MNIDQISTYELLSTEEIKDIDSIGYLLRHKKSGARIMVLSNSDENKVFNIAFRTPPEDSTGLPHILEHSVLCGSKKFPSKDPFVELVKGSLNTFLNAMTFPDKTMYPIASYNDKDFQNLMHVYMDAVFYTNIYNKEEIFRQEGWNYNLESEDGEITYNGVVYNEMKGAFSSPEGVLDREILNSLFPDNAYSFESGGDPLVIPELKYSQFLSFHSKYYHPSNSYIYLYGNMDVVEKLQWLDEEYLSKYDEMEIHSEIALQEPFKETREIRKKYSITEGETTKDNTYLSYNMVIGDSLDAKLSLAFQILEYALLSAPGAPLKQSLLDAKIGKDIMGSYDNGIYQPMFSIIAKNSNLEQKEEFLSLIHDTLEEIYSNKINEKALLAGLNFYEFKFREADYGMYPKGLMYCLEAFNSWLYDDQKPFLHLKPLSIFEELRQEIGTGYFENLMKEYLMENNHSSVVIIEPEKGLTANIDQQTVEKLQQYKESLSKEQIEQMVSDTKKLLEFQETPSTKEELLKIPMLNREDIKREAAPIYNTELKAGDTLLLHHNLSTNGIGYLNILFDTNLVPETLLPYMAILKSVLGYIDTNNFKYGELFNEININSGGIYTSLSLYPNLKNKKDIKVAYEVKAKVLYSQMDFAFDMIKEILFGTKFDDEKRLYEIIAQLKSRLQMSLTSAGHSSAATRSMSYFSPVSYLSDLTGGISFYRLIEEIESDFDGKKEQLIANLKELMHYIFRPENMMVSYTSDESGLDGMEQRIIDLKKDLYTTEVKAEPYTFSFAQLNEGFKTSSKVQYVARSGNFVTAGYQYTGALKILKVILSYEYLWTNIRVKGGAYGCMSGFNKLGDTYFVSYRDPNLEKTNEIYEGITDYVKNFQVDERDMTKYIIGTISDMDVPMNPSAKGSRSLGVYLTKQTFEELQEEKNQVLDADINSIRELADLMEAVLRQNNLCVIGSEEKIEEQSTLFKTVEQLVK